MSIYTKVLEIVHDNWTTLIQEDVDIENDDHNTFCLRESKKRPIFGQEKSSSVTWLISQIDNRFHRDKIYSERYKSSILGTQSIYFEIPFGGITEFQTILSPLDF